MARYTPSEIEAKWQEAWEKSEVFKALRNADKPKYYVLEMFPYPSGRIHIGHVRNYTMGDVIARYKMATGHNVLHPMGFDAFGMPAENAAMASGGHPKDWTYQNIDDMVAQMKPLGFGLDWSRMFATCDPEYYGQQQALFLDMLEAGLVYRKNAVVNWDPVDMTVLANEQVIDGKGWRSGAEVERRELTQWFFKISDMAEELLDALDTLDDWPAKVKLMQANWIGKSRGIEVPFDRTDDGDPVICYSTRPDTLRGATFLAISPEHPISRELAETNPELAEFIAECRKMDTTEAAMEKAEKKGINTGITVRHPIWPDKELPLWVGNFVLMEYGTGAIYGCPAHDQRDLDFARKYDLPVVSAFHMPGDASEIATEALVPSKDRSCNLYRSLHRRHRRYRSGCDRPQHRLDGRQRPGPGTGQVPPARLGPQPPAVLGLPDPCGALRYMRRGAREEREPPGRPCLMTKTARPSISRYPATRWTVTQVGATAPARNAAVLHDARRTRWTPSWTARGILRASPPRAPRRPQAWKTPATG